MSNDIPPNPQEEKKQPLAEINPVSLKHNLFVLSLFKFNFNATKAYIHTYPDANPFDAHAHASRLIANDKIKELIRRRLLELDIKTVASVEFVLNGLMELALNAKDENTRKSAFDSLGKYNAMFTDKIKGEGLAPSVFNINKTYAGKGKKPKHKRINV